MSFLATPLKGGSMGGSGLPPLADARLPPRHDDDAGYYSDVAPSNMSDASNDLVASQRALEQTFKDRYSVLRSAYEARIKALQEMISECCAGLFSDELLHEMKQDRTSSAFIPAHISELLSTHLEGERERYLHQVVQHLSSVETELARSREKTAQQGNRIARLEEACAQGRRAELEVEPLKRQVAALQEASAEAQRHSHEALSRLEEAHTALQADHNELIHEHEEACAQLDARSAQLAALHHQQAERERDVRALETSVEQSTRDLAVIESVDRQERLLKAEMKEQLLKLSEARDGLVAEVHTLTVRLQQETHRAAQLSAQHEADESRDAAVQSKVSQLMRQMQDMMAAESAEADQALAAMQDKLVSTRARLTQELAREKRLAAALSEECQAAKIAKSEMARDMKRLQEEDEALRDRLNKELAGRAALQAQTEAAARQAAQASSAQHAAELAQKELALQLAAREQRLLETEVQGAARVALAEERTRCVRVRVCVRVTTATPLFFFYLFLSSLSLSPEPISSHLSHLSPHEIHPQPQTANEPRAREPRPRPGATHRRLSTALPQRAGRSAVLPATIRRRHEDTLRQRGRGHGRGAGR